MPRRNRKLDRSVTCRITLIVGGRAVKTTRRRLSVAQAIREIGRDPVGTEGQLMSGAPVKLGRRVTPAVRVALTYSADHRPVPQVHAASFDLNTANAVIVARAHLAG
jgi:hypothetical protein